MNFLNYINEHEPTINVDDVKRVIKCFIDWNIYYKEHHCSICLKPLTEKEKLSVSGNDFHYTCSKHRKYSKQFQIDIIRREAKIKIKL